MGIGCFDQRPLDEIRNDLIGLEKDEIDLLCVCIVLCDHIRDLEAQVKALQEAPNGRTNKSS